MRIFSLVSASYFQHNCPGELPAEIGSVFILQELCFTVAAFLLDVQFYNWNPFKVWVIKRFF